MASTRSFAEHIIEFIQGLDTTIPLPDGVDWIYPFKQPEVVEMATRFYTQYYSDTKDRHFLFGINPGRLGAGMTGVPFTDPILLEDKCGIANEAQKKHELSSLFIYEMIEHVGGLDWFFKRYYISSLCPLGFIKEKKNFNYYDSRELMSAVKGFIVESVEKQVSKYCKSDKAFSLGQGKNFKIFAELNQEYKWFEEVIPLPHPRWVMQYKRKHKSKYLDEYLLKLNP
ncbi:MAG: DUF4918 family protein [Saprospiraceae bacterium]|nr:DUF4918 family protein [Saprospiraceae bacterium]